MIINKNNKKLEKKIPFDNIYYFSDDLNTLNYSRKNNDVNYYNDIFNYLVSKENAFDNNTKKNKLG